MEIDIQKVIIEGDLANVVYGYGYAEDEFREVADKLYDDVEEILTQIYRERYLLKAIGSRCIPALDCTGHRYVKCVQCGCIAESCKFITYGDNTHVNDGVCKKCYKEYERSDYDAETYSNIDEYLNSSNPTVTHIRY